MLLNDLLVMLHVRVRIYIHKEVKVAALKAKKDEKFQRQAMRAKKAARKAEILKNQLSAEVDGSNGTGKRRSRSRSKSPFAFRHPQGESSGAVNEHMKHKRGVSFDKIVAVENPVLTASPLTHGKSTESLLNDEFKEKADSSDEEDEDEEDEEEDDATDSSKAPAEETTQHGEDGTTSERRGSGRSSELETSELEEEEDLDLTPSFLQDPERATRGQRRWLDEICRGEDPVMVKGFRK